MTALRTLPTLLVLGFATIALAGCGSSSSSSSPSSAATDKGAVTHVDGTIVAHGDGFTLSPTHGGEKLEFTPGSSVEGVQVKALEASGAPARVSYRMADKPPYTAVSVTPTPSIGEGMQSFAGTITQVSSSSITLTNSHGKARTFDISGADPDAFDVSHLKEHKSEGSPVKVYFDPKQPDAGLAYEDA
jgi:hypothetical protein